MIADAPTPEARRDRSLTGPEAAVRAHVNIPQVTWAGGKESLMDAPSADRPDPLTASAP